MAEIDRLGENIEEFEQFGFDEHDPYFLHCISLNLHCNRLTHLHGLPKKLSSLTELNLSSNEFSSCDLPELAFLSCLKTLDLSANRIESLATLPFLPTLTTLSIAYNNLTTFDGLEENTPNLMTLDARGNFVSERYDVFALPALLQLVDVQLTNNPIANREDELRHIWDTCPSLVRMDGQTRDQMQGQGLGQGQGQGQGWKSSHIENGNEERDGNAVDPPRSVEVIDITPRFDRIANWFKQRQQQQQPIQQPSPSQQPQQQQHQLAVSPAIHTPSSSSVSTLIAIPATPPNPSSFAPSVLDPINAGYPLPSPIMSSPLLEPPTPPTLTISSSLPATTPTATEAAPTSSASLPTSAAPISTATPATPTTIPLISSAPPVVNPLVRSLADHLRRHVTLRLARSFYSWHTHTKVSLQRTAEQDSEEQQQQQQQQQQEEAMEEERRSFASTLANMTAENERIRTALTETTGRERILREQEKHQTNSHHRKIVQLEAQLLALRTENKANQDRSKSLELASTKTAELQAQCQLLERLLQEKQNEMEEVVEKLEREKEAIEGRCVAMAAAATANTTLRDQLAASLLVREQLEGDLRKGVRVLEEKDQRLTASGRENSMLKRRCGEMQTMVNELQTQIKTLSLAQSSALPQPQSQSQPLTQSQSQPEVQAQSPSQSAASTSTLPSASASLPTSDLAFVLAETKQALDRLTAEHTALQQVHGEMQIKANKCVKRLLAVHNAFEEVTSTNHTLKNTIQTLQAAKLEREVTIDELRACVRQYQQTLRDQQQQQQQQQQQHLAASSTTTPTNATTTTNTTTVDPDPALVPTPSGQAPVCQRCVRLETRLRSQKQHLLRMQQEVRSHRDALEHMQYRQSCDSTILQSIFGHKDKGKGLDQDKGKGKGLNKDDDKGSKKEETKNHGSDHDKVPDLGEKEEKEEEKEETPSSGHPPLSTSQTSLSLSFSLSAIDDSTDFLRSPLQQRTGDGTNATQHRYSNSNQRPSESRRSRRRGGKEGDQGLSQGQGRGQGLHEGEGEDYGDDNGDESAMNDSDDSRDINDNHDAIGENNNHNQSHSHSQHDLTGTSDTHHSHTNDDSAQQSRLGELSSKLDFLDGELRRRVSELVEAGQRIHDLESQLTDNHTALQVKECMLNDQTITITELRARVQGGETRIGELLGLVAEYERKASHYQEDIHTLSDKVADKRESERRLRGCVEDLERANRRLKRRLREWESDSEEDEDEEGSEEGGSEEGEEEGEGNEGGVVEAVRAGEEEDGVDDDSLGGERVVGIAMMPPTNTTTNNNNNIILDATGVNTNTAPSDNTAAMTSSGSMTSGGVGGIISTALVPHLHATTDDGVPASMTATTSHPRRSTSKTIPAVSVSRHKRSAVVVSQLQTQIALLESQLMEAAKTSNNDILVHEQENVRAIRALTLEATQRQEEAAAVHRQQRDALMIQLMGKERESVQAAQSLVLLEGKLEQLASKLALTQQRSDLQSEAFHEERKRLHRQIRSLQAELTAKEEEVRRVRAAADQLRMLVASGTLGV